MIQAFNPYHQVLQQVSTTDYAGMFKDQLQERWQFHYPLYFRLIKITLKHKDYQKVNAGINGWQKYFKTFSVSTC